MTHTLGRSPALRRWLALAITAVLGAGLWTATNSAAATSSVSIQNFSFQPPDLTVHPGDTVTWTNHDSETHAVQGGPLSSPDLTPGSTYSFTFTSVGDVNYICRIHTYMSGVVHVIDATSTTTAPPSTTATTAPPSSTTTVPGATTTTAPGATTTTTANATLPTSLIPPRMVTPPAGETFSKESAARRCAPALPLRATRLPTGSARRQRVRGP